MKKITIKEFLQVFFDKLLQLKPEYGIHEASKANDKDRRRTTTLVCNLLLELPTEVMAKLLGVPMLNGFDDILAANLLIEPFERALYELLKKENLVCDELEIEERCKELRKQGKSVPINPLKLLSEHSKEPIKEYKIIKPIIEILKERVPKNEKRQKNTPKSDLERADFGTRIDGGVRSHKARSPQTEK